MYRWEIFHCFIDGGVTVFDVLSWRTFELDTIGM